MPELVLLELTGEGREEETVAEVPMEVITVPLLVLPVSVTVGADVADVAKDAVVLVLGTDVAVTDGMEGG